MVYVTGDWWSTPLMKSVMVEEITVVNRLIDLHVVVTHILPEASSIVEVRLKHRN